MMRKLLDWRIPAFFLLPLCGCFNNGNRPNILLLTLDTLRADALGCYGSMDGRTPNLDRLAQEGVLFEDAVCQIPATLTSHTAIMTGRNPKTTGVRFRTARVPLHEKTIGEVFHAAGYETAAFISSFVLAPEFGLNQGFERYEMGGISPNGGAAPVERRAEETIDQVILYLSHHPKIPFFIWVHLYDPHTPYDAPPPYSSMFDPSYAGSLKGSVEEITRLNAAKGEGLSERDRRRLRALYLGETAYMDHHIGRLLDKLKQSGLSERTVVAAIADHGENLGEGGRFFHGDDLYQPAAHVPLIMRYPKRLNSGERTAAPVQSIDLFPTLLELANIAPAAGVEGISLLPLCSKQKAEFQSKLAYMETEADPVTEGNKIYGLRAMKNKFLYHSAHRRPEVPLGVFTEIPLKGPTIVMLRVQGDPAIRLMAHVRYRTEALYASRDFQALATLPTTVIHAETAGSDPVHKEAMESKAFLNAPDGWRTQMTPDLHRIARSYGQAQGWPVNWMVLEGVGVDASIPHKQKSAVFAVDQIEAFAPSLRFPSSPRLRFPFWIIEDFENAASRGLADAGEGPPHTIQSEWLYESLLNGKQQQKITITFPSEIEADALDELFDLSRDPLEERNLLTGANTEKEPAQTAAYCRTLLDSWIAKKAGETDARDWNPAQLEALEALGYTK
ncbi:MAG: sulfatase [Candidatus Omnitrophota bacterium]